MSESIAGGAEAAGVATKTEPVEKYRVKILMVDDQPENLVALEAVLEGLGQELVQARSGKEALRCLLENEFAAILLDVKMPDMDGFECAAMIRERERSKNTPIIFLTALKSEEHLFRGYYMGAVDYLFKPIVPEVLRSKVAVFVDLSLKNEILRRNAGVLQQKAAELEKSIAEKTKAEEDLRRLNAELEQRVAERTEELSRSNEELRQFAYVASHDLQEPLRTIGSYTQLLAKRYKGKLDGDADEFVRFIVEGVARMHGLLNDMLAYSRVTDAHEKPMRPTSVDGILQSALMNLEASIKENAALITHDPLPTVTADEIQLSQVFQNLIGNAIKYRRPEQPVIHISSQQKDGEWLFRVSDNGIGFEDKFKDRIFGIFKRLHGKDLPGTGVGLAICKKIVERHGGRIWAESTLGEGSVFQFTLPM
ncbi:MAG TPA: ATP-binding protein [Bryobacteraceae bacterium]|nr:ATP-binding protein [Bryobacteraceae bacterium]